MCKYVHVLEWIQTCVHGWVNTRVLLCLPRNSRHNDSPGTTSTPCALDTNQGSWPSPINRNWPEARQEMQARLYWGPCCSRGEREQVTVSLARSPRRGRAGSLYGVRVGVCPGVELRWFAHPFGGAVRRGHAQYPAFAPNTLFLLRALQKWQLGFLVFCIFLSIICLNCACRQLFLVPYSFFVFCCWRRGLSRCKHCSTAAKGPRSQPVSS